MRRRAATRLGREERGLTLVEMLMTAVVGSALFW